MKNFMITCETNEDGGKVYLVEDGHKRWITSMEVFRAYGFRWENINIVTKQEIESLPTGEPLGPLERDDFRYEISAPFLKGRGIEVGAGAYPQRLPKDVICEYYDKRTESELAQFFNVAEKDIPPVYPLNLFWKRFPDGVDFLIAHNVLEHTSNPIKELITWNSYVKYNGVINISVPDAGFCSDHGRLITPKEHVLLDYLFDRNDDSFESREHIYSFLMGWADEGMFKEMDKLTLAKNAHICTHAAQADLHWHAFNEDLVRFIITTAALFSKKRIRIEAIATPFKEDPYHTLVDIIYVYRIEGPLNNSGEIMLHPEINETIKIVNKKLLNAQDRLNAAKCFK